MWDLDTEWNRKTHHTIQALVARVEELEKHLRNASLDPDGRRQVLQELRQIRKTARMLKKDFAERYHPLSKGRK